MRQAAGAGVGSGKGWVERDGRMERVKRAVTCLLVDVLSVYRTRVRVPCRPTTCNPLKGGAGQGAPVPPRVATGKASRRGIRMPPPPTHAAALRASLCAVRRPAPRCSSSLQERAQHATPVPTWLAAAHVQAGYSPLGASTAALQQRGRRKTGVMAAWRHLVPAPPDADAARWRSASPRTITSTTTT
jgi:hypothetical protein